MQDPRRRVPRTDTLLADPAIAAASARLGPDIVREIVRAAQQRVRDGELAPPEIVDAVLAALPASASSLRPVLNATGVVVHTNLGRAPLSDEAVRAIVAAGGYVDVEFDLGSGERARRGRGLLDALRSAVPAAGDAFAVNNGAAALVLATTVLGAGREIVVSRGELVEIGDGFRLPDLIESTGARLREVGTTNRVTLADYRAVIGERTGAVLKVHPSNFRIDGFTASVDVADLASLDVPVIADLGSGLLHPSPLLPDEPDVTTALLAGAAVVTGSGDKLLGGPQAGLLFGRADVIETLRRHPLARALRIDKLTVAALEATLRGPRTPVQDYLHADTEQRTRDLAARLGLDVAAVDGVVGGGGAPGVPLPGWALVLPEHCAARLRGGSPQVVARVDRGRCLVDLRCVPPAQDGVLARAVADAVR